MNKKIVLCRRHEQAREMVLALQNEKAWPIVFPTFELEPVAVSEEDMNKIKNVEWYDWLIFGSRNGVVFFTQLLSDLNFSLSGTSVKIATVGDKTAHSWNRAFSEIPVLGKADNINQLLKNVSYENSEMKLKILNPTSQQSLQNIEVDVPENILLDRISLYRTVPHKSHHPSEVEFVRLGDYDAVFFGSPSSFDYYLDIVGDAPLLRGVAICVTGNTTADYIRRAGFEVNVIPNKPDVRHIINGLRNFFNQARN